MEQKKSILFTPTGLHVREGEEGASASGRTIEGCAIVFNQETTLWDGKYERIREIIAPSCVTPAFLAEQDIKLNLLHERDTSIARNNKGQGSLVLDLREDGLYFSFEAPQCDLGDRALALVKNGTYTGCSFEFYEDEFTTQNTTLPDGREDVLYTHTKMKSITALTIAMDPAYEQTSVEAREAKKREENHVEPSGEAEGTEAEAKKKAEQEKADAFNREVTSIKKEAQKALRRLNPLY